MRVLIQVDADWQVTISCPDRGKVWPSRQLRKLADGNGGTFPAPPKHECQPGDDSPHYALCVADEGGPLLAAYQKIAERRPDLGGVEQFGRYLFDTLIGETAWHEIKQEALACGARNIELALSWSPSQGNAHRPNDLHRLNWEMMRSREGYLAAGSGRLGVAITRLVANTPHLKAFQLKVPPRVLFVIGTSLVDPRIRPGAEYLGLLRQLKASGRSINSRVLENASPRRMQDEVASFQPDVVHFICHGYLDHGRGYLELQTDEKEVDPRRYADQILQSLRIDGDLPQIVVLSACYSGVAESRMLRADETAPLAVELVEGGIPIVLGMAGRVSDLACRLFTRRFGEALAQGEPLVVATAEARRTTFAEGAPPHKSADWAFPSLFMAEGVASDYIPVQATDSDIAMQIKNRITTYDIECQPVFCGRYDLLHEYHELFKPQGRRVLAVYVDQSTPGFGRARLLKEFTIQALRDGHVPVLISFEGQSVPQSVVDLGRAVLGSINRVREAFDLGLPLVSQLGLVTRSSIQEATGHSELDQYIRDELEQQNQVTTRAVRLALQKDLATLATDARDEHSMIRDAMGRVLVLLDKVDRYPQAAQPLLKEMLNGFGLGTKVEPVPVVLTFSLGGPMDNVLRAFMEAPRDWLRLKQLKTFQDNGEDMLAYELVLMNPFSDVVDKVSNRAWTINDEAAAETVAKWQDKFRLRIGGKPDRLGSETMYVLADLASEDGFLIEANDEALLRRVRA